MIFYTQADTHNSKTVFETENEPFNVVDNGDMFLDSFSWIECIYRVYKIEWIRERTHYVQIHWKHSQQ